MKPFRQVQLKSVLQDHEYGYRQGMFKDPFGHYWQIQKKYCKDKYANLLDILRIICENQRRSVNLLCFC